MGDGVKWLYVATRIKIILGQNEGHSDFIKIVFSYSEVILLPWAHEV